MGWGCARLHLPRFARCCLLSGAFFSVRAREGSFVRHDVFCSHVPRHVSWAFDVTGHSTRLFVPCVWVVCVLCREVCACGRVRLFCSVCHRPSLELFAVAALAVLCRVGASAGGSGVDFSRRSRHGTRKARYSVCVREGKGEGVGVGVGVSSPTKHGMV